MLNRRRVVQGGLAAAGSLDRLRAVWCARAGQAAGQGPLQRSGALDPLRAGLRRHHQGLFQGRRPRRVADHGAGRRQVGRGAAVQQRRHRADRAGDRRSTCRTANSPTKTPIFCGLTATDGFMLVEPREGRQVRMEHAQGQGNPRLPAGQHAAPVPRGGAAAERHRPAQGRQAQQQRRDPGARRLLARRPEPVRHLHRAGRLAARARRQGALPRLDRRDRGPGRLHHLHGDRQIHQRESGGHPGLDRRDLQGAEVDRVAAAGGGRQGDRAVLPGRQSAGAGRRGRALPQAQHLEDARRRSSRRPWRSSRTSWCRATCSTTPSA